MRAWSSPETPAPGAVGPEIQVWSSAAGALVPVTPSNADGVARLYVCGITPYDATHMGHAATYIAFDLLNRAWRNAGHDVRFVQNVTDVDDPLLERASDTGQDWEALASREIQLFREDMEALRVLPPSAYVGAVESIPLVVEMIAELQSEGAAYRVDDDLYFPVTVQPGFGDVSRLDEATMNAYFAERGGDPEREGKKHPLDCLLWQGERPNDPAWDTAIGRGRPGWHIECSAIARRHLGDVVDVVGGGSDLVFPHHEMGAAEAIALGVRHAAAYVHAGMVALDGEKMSKSRGNLVFVSKLRESGVDPMAIRLAVLAHHYRSDWEWTDADLTSATERLSRWRAAVALDPEVPAIPVVERVLASLADDLNAPRALDFVDQWATLCLDAGGSGEFTGSVEEASAHAIRSVVDAALGIAL